MRVLYTYRTVVGGARREIGFGRLGAFVTSELRRGAQQYDNIVTVMLLWYVDLWAQLGGGLEGTPWVLRLALANRFRDYVSANILIFLTENKYEIQLFL